MIAPVMDRSTLTDSDPGGPNVEKEWASGDGGFSNCVPDC